MASETLRLWVDAICIDQTPEDNKEKSMQIALMTKIYGMAKEVCVWLGEAGDGSRKAMEFVNKLVDLDDENHIAGFDRDEKEKKELAEELDALIRLLKRGWFSRRWVVQEIAMARRATLHCGADKVPWSKLADAIALLEKVGRDGTINRTLKQHAPKQGRASEYVGSFSSLPAYRLVQNTTGMFRGQDKKDIRTWRYTLEELISFLAAFQASRLHDTVYALLGLASDAKPAPPESPPLLPPAPGAGISRHRSYSMESVQLRKAGPTFAKRVSTTFEVDYSLSPLAVFKQFLEHAIGRSQSLDIICRPWAPEEGFDANGNSQTVKLPSWIPSLNRKPFRPTRHGDMVRFNPDPLVGPASFRHRFYQASGPGIVKPKYRFLEGSELELQGFEVGEIGQAWDAGTFGNVPATWLRAGGWKSEADPPPDDLWRALVADRNGMGDDPDRWYPMVFQTAAKDRGINYGFETHRLIHESTNARVAELFRRVQAVVWDRRLITVTGGFADWLKENEALSQREEQGVEVENGEEAVEEESEAEVNLSEEAAAERAAASGPTNGTTSGNTNGTTSGNTNGEVKGNANGTSSATVPNAGGGGATEQTTAKEKGKALGLSPCEAQIGDKVCIIFGCSVPLVLRKIVDTDKYVLIGECYLDHTMDGEAMTYFEKMVKGRKMVPDGTKFTLR